VRRVLADTGLPPRHLTLELTESLLLEDTEAVVDLLRQLKELGVSLSLDDFGTGYSSLSYLKRFPVDTVKIDRSFVSELSTNVDDESIVTAIIATAHSLAIRVVAEGWKAKAGSPRSSNANATRFRATS